MKFYTTPEGFSPIRKQMIVAGIIPPSLVAAITVGFGVLSGDKESLQVSLLMIPVYTIGALVGILLSLKKQKARFLSLMITIEDNVLTRTQIRRSVVTIQARDIMKIERYRSGTIIIRGREKWDEIRVPRSINNYEQLVGVLSGFKPIVDIPSGRTS